MLKNAAIVLLAAAAVTTAGCDWDSRADTLPPYLHRVVTVPVEIRDGYRVEREFAGEVQAGQSSQLGFEFPGQVADLRVDVGDAVEPGQLLARLDLRLLESERAELQARRKELGAELDTAERNLARVERLQAERLASERERDELSGRTRALRAALQRVDASLEANAVRLDKSELRAPFAAVIAERRIDTGQVVAAGAPVFDLVQAAVREVQAGVPVALADTLAPGDAVRVRSGAREAGGIVAGLGPVVDPATRSRALRVRVDENWSPGDLAYVALGLPVEKEGAWLPDTAVTEGARGAWVAYAAVPAGDGEGTLEARSVVVHHARGNELYVSGALGDGERIVGAGLHRLAPGQRVRMDGPEPLADAR